MGIQWSTDRCDLPGPINECEELQLTNVVTASVLIGVNRITIDNCDEWELRVRVMQRAGLRLWLQDMQACVMSVRWVGLTVECEEMTREQFMNRVMKMLEYRVESDMVDDRLKHLLVELIPGVDSSDKNEIITALRQRAAGDK